jgi:hypothetical protein
VSPVGNSTVRGLPWRSNSSLHGGSLGDHLKGVVGRERGGQSGASLPLQRPGGELATHHERVTPQGLAWCTFGEFAKSPLCRAVFHRQHQGFDGERFVGV